MGFLFINLFDSFHGSSTEIGLSRISFLQAAHIEILHNLSCDINTATLIRQLYETNSLLTCHLVSCKKLGTLNYSIKRMNSIIESLENILKQNNMNIMVTLPTWSNFAPCLEF